MNKILALLLIGGYAAIAQGRIMQTPPNYQQMFEQADLVAIARPVATNATPERMLLPHIAPDIEVAGVETEFEVQTMLKGDKAAHQKFILHHYRTVKENIYMNAPMLVAFDPTNPEAVLLFLKKEADGRFAPIYNQTDPGMCGFEPAQIIDLIAIAKPVSPRKQTEQKMSEYSRPAVRLTGYQTEFAVEEVLQGDQSEKKIVLHHFERTGENDGGFSRINFQPERERRYLLILRKEAEGRFAPIIRPGWFERETSPAGFSVIKLPLTEKADVNPSITGTVRDESGKPVAGMRMSAYGESQMLLAWTQTDAAGHFVFTNVAKGSVRVSTAIPGDNNAFVDTQGGATNLLLKTHRP